MLNRVKRMVRKSKQNRKYTLSTGDNDLAEATTSKIWGTGLKLNDPNNSMRNNWTGQNVTGEVLKTIRCEIN